MTLSSPMFILVSVVTELPSTVGDETTPIGDVEPATVTAGAPGVGPGWTGVAVAAAVMMPWLTATTVSIGAMLAPLDILKYCQKLIRYRSGDIRFYKHVTDTYSFHRNVISSISISVSFLLFWLIFTQQYIFIPLSFDTVFFTVTIDLDIRRLTISKFHSLFSLIVYMFSHFLFWIWNRVMKN
jgi:hypothetical protein